MKYAKVPEALIADPDVNDSAVRVYAALRRHEWALLSFGTPLPTHAELAAELGRDPKSVQRAVVALDRAGWLDVERNGRGQWTWIKCRDSQRVDTAA